jgi:two-component sensor histidine kinase
VRSVNSTIFDRRKALPEAPAGTDKCVLPAGRHGFEREPMTDTIAAYPTVEGPGVLQERALAAVDSPDAKRESGLEAPWDRAYHWIVAAVCLYVSVALALLQIATMQGPDLPSLTPFFVAGVLATELPTGFLLFVLTRGTRSWSLLMLGCAYLFGSLMSVFHLLTFPGAVLPDYIILGTDQSARWIYNFWYAGFAILALIAVVLEIRGGHIAAKHVDRAIGIAILGVLITIAATASVAIFAVNSLPELIRGSSWTNFDIFLLAGQLVVLIAGIGLILGILRGRNPIFLLMSLVLTAMVFSQILSIEGPGRYTVGWIVGRLSWFLAACILFLFFMVQFARQQKFLVRSQEVLEDRVAARTVELTGAIKQRDLLLRELHHRVKNKMQMVDALVATQARHSGDAAARKGLQDVRSRIYVLALAHQQLMQSDFETFDIAPFLRQLTDNILANRAEKSIELVVETIPLMVAIDFAAPLGLLATELVIDSLDHSSSIGGRVVLTLRLNITQAVVLSVSDNRRAASLRVDADSRSPTQRTKVIRGLVGQLDGTITERFSDGLHVEIVLPAQERPNE